MDAALNAKIVGVAGALVALVALSGCSAEKTSPASGSSGGPVWAAEFERVRQETQNDLARSILEDDAITDRELEEIRESFRKCVAPIGVTEVEFSVTGGIRTNTPDGVDAQTVQDALDRCGAETGYDGVAYLYGQMTTNPNNEDPTKALVECLARHGVVEPGYSADDFNKEMGSTGGAPAFLQNEEAQKVMQSCQNDPRN